MAPKLKNKPLSREDSKAYAVRAAVLRDESIAREAAKVALQYWYETSYSCAEAQIPLVQINSLEGGRIDTGMAGNEMHKKCIRHDV